MKSKKAMGIGQVFTFIIAALVFAMIMLFGYKAITEFVGRGEDIQLVQFKNDIESSVRSIYSQYGAEKVQDFYLPSKYSQICFINLEAGAEVIHAQKDELCKSDTNACILWEEAAAAGDGAFESIDENVFLTPSSLKIKVYRLEIDNNEQQFLCLPITQGHFTLHLEGRGDRTAVSHAQQVAYE